MYESWLAEEQVEIWRQQTRQPTNAERERAEVLRTHLEAGPSLLQRFAGIFRAEPAGPDPFIARTPAEAEFVISGLLGLGMQTGR